VSTATGGNGAILDLPGLSGGFGGVPTDKTVTHTYFYFGKFAVGFGYGDPDALDKTIIQVHANGKLIYDVGSAHPDEALMEGVPRKFFPGLKFRFYPGTMTQEPDPTIMDYENRKYEIEMAVAAGTGPNIVPANRGMMYIVFDNLPLAQFNNQLPEITVTLADVTSREVLNDIYDGTSGTVQANEKGLGLDWASATMYSIFGGKIFTIDLSTNAVVNVATPDRTYSNFAYSPYTGQLYATSVNAVQGVNSYAGTSVWNVDPITGFGVIVSALDAHLGLGPYRNDFVQPMRLIVTPLLTDGGAIVDDLYLLTADGGTTLWNVNANAKLYESGSIYADLIPGPLGKTPTLFYDYANAVHKLVGEIVAGVGTSGFLLLYTPPGGWWIKGMIYSEKDNRLFVLLNDANLVATEGRLVSIDAGNGHVYWDIRSLHTWSVFLPGATSYIYASDTTGDAIAIPNSGRIFTFRIDDGEILFDDTAISSDPQFSVGSGTFEAVYGPKTPYYYNKANISRTTLKAFILFAARMAGLTTTGLTPQIEVDDAIDDIIIDGAYIDQVNFSLRDLLKNLKLAFMFDIIEGEDLIHCVKRPEDSPPDDFEFDAPEDLLLVEENDDAVLPIQRDGDDQIPRRITYGFLDFVRDFEQNFAYAERISFPDPTNFSKATLDIGVPIIMRYHEAEEWAYKVLYGLWRARNGYSFRLPPRLMTLEPGDAGLITSQGRTYSVKVDKVTYNPDFSLSAVVSSYVTDYPIAINVDPPRWEQFTLQFESQTIALLFDIPDPFPLVNEFAETDGQRAKLFIQAGPQLAHRIWKGGYIQFLTDQGIYSTLFSVATNLLHQGNVITAPNTKTAGTVFQVDYDSTLDVQLVDTSQTFATLTDDDFTNTLQNMLLIGSELLRFKTATDLGSGLWRLTTLQRGLRGTDQSTAHYAGEKVYLLTPTNTFTQRFSSAYEGEKLSYHTSSTGAIEASGGRYVTILFEGNTNRPEPVVNWHAKTSGANLVLDWQERTRAPGQTTLIDGDDEVVLTDWETVTQFEMDFYTDGTYATIAGTVSDDNTEGLSSSSYTATLDAAKRTSVLGGSAIPAVIYVKIYKISGQWGRGIARTATIYVE
jgi:hypothetical protein